MLAEDHAEADAFTQPARATVMMEPTVVAPPAAQPASAAFARAADAAARAHHATCRRAELTALRRARPMSRRLRRPP